MASTDWTTSTDPIGIDIDRALLMAGGPTGQAKYQTLLHAIGVEANAEPLFQPPPPPPPPPPAKTQMGSSVGAWGAVPAMASALGLKAGNVVRAFDVASAKAVGPGVSLCFSDDGGNGRGYDLVGSPAAAVSSWASILLNVFRDDAPHYWICAHEEDTPANGGNYARLAQVTKGMKSVLAKVNPGRKFPIKTVTCTTGMPYGSNAYQNWVFPDTDIIGVDNYNRAHWSTIIAWSAKTGKPWGCPETGYAAGATQNISDSNLRAAMVADHGFYDGQAEFICYWPNWTQDLRNKPLALAQLRTYVAAGTV